MIEFKRTYKGTVIAMRLLQTDILGYRHYSVTFKSGRAYYAYPIKRTLPITVGAQIRFTGEWRGEGAARHFVIDDVVDSSYLDQLEFALDEDKRKWITTTITDRQ